MNFPIEQEYCCVLEVCCGGANKRKAKATLAAKIVTATGIDLPAAEKVSDFVLDTFDLAPEGTLKDFKTIIAAMAREYPYNDA